MAILLVTLSVHKDYDAVFTLLKLLGDERITWIYTEMRLFDAYAQLNWLTASRQTGMSGKTGDDTATWHLNRTREDEVFLKKNEAPRPPKTMCLKCD